MTAHTQRQLVQGASLFAWAFLVTVPTFAFYDYEVYLGWAWLTLITGMSFLLLEQLGRLNPIRRSFLLSLVVVFAAFAGMYYAGGPPAPEGAIRI